LKKLHHLHQPSVKQTFNHTPEPNNHAYKREKSTIMTTNQLLAPPTHLTHTESLRLSQLAPRWLRSQAPSTLPYPLSLLTTSESAEQWQACENLLIACLRTGDDETALNCLNQLTARFGDENERVQALRGLYHEAVAVDEKALLHVLSEYEALLVERPANVPVRKRRVALLKGMGRVGEATKALTDLLDSSPIDAEAWAELADLYFVQSLLSQAVFCLEEVLLITPNAWNVCLFLFLSFFSLQVSFASR
jgi:tetratricopeptide (TPR) repeat protein